MEETGPAVNLATALLHILQKTGDMKKTFFLFCACCFVLAATAQTKASKNKNAQRTTAKKTTVNRDTVRVSLVNTARYDARAGRYRISDPTINRMNQRAAGYDLPLGASGIAGMPRGSYGFANGKILLRNTTATTPGTGYGSGGVGTGTALQGPGTSEAAVGVNGKSPYAGPWLWGDRRLSQPAMRRDSVRGQ